MHAIPKRPCLSWTALALLATSLLASGGCAKFYHGWHYNCLTRPLYEHRLSYYHSPHTGRIIPKEHHQVCPVEFPCFGYESTCWHRWPEECTKCPVNDSSGVIIDQPYEGQEIIREEVIGQPVESKSESAEPVPAEPDSLPPRDADGLLDESPLPTSDAKSSRSVPSYETQAADVAPVAVPDIDVQVVEQVEEREVLAAPHHPLRVYPVSESQTTLGAADAEPQAPVATGRSQVVSSRST